MSSKVCVSPWNGGPHKTSDTVTIGQLVSMLAALSVLGYDEDTPVTFLFDDDHAWLETVDFPVEPRVVDELGEGEKFSEWVDCDGDRWKWDGKWTVSDDSLNSERLIPDLIPNSEFGPYIEVLE